MTPDVAAILSLRCAFPWTAGTIEPLAPRLAAELARDAPDEAVAYLSDVRDGLVLGRWDRYPHRPIFSSEMPLATPTMM